MIAFLLFRSTKMSVLFLTVMLSFIRFIIGIRYKVSGQFPEGDYIVAAKHFSYIDVLILVSYCKSVNFVLKKELRSMPIIGWYMELMGLTYVDRSNYKQSLRSMAAAAKNKINSKLGKLIVFPEGQRVGVGDAADYKSGIFLMYRTANKPIVPVALNSGLFWSKDNVIRPGEILVSILPAIEPGLSRDVFMATLENSIETQTKKLLQKGMATL